MKRPNPKAFKYVRSLVWSDVFDIWRKNEADNPQWAEIYKPRGFGSWEEWRKSYTEPLKLAGREWSLYKVLNPMQTIPNFRGGPFATWVEKYYGGKELPVFREVVEYPGVYEHERINRLAEGFPEETSLIGLSTNKGVVVLEGMHRCCAVALAAERGRVIQAKIFIALADFSGNLPVLGQAHQGNKDIA